MDLFTQIPQNLQDALSTNAGIILKEFDPNGSLVKETIRQNILFATTGGVSVSCVQEMKDLGEDIDNCPKDSKELIKILRYICKLEGTAVTLTKEGALSLLGSADASGSEVVKILPRIKTALADFKTLWYVCDYGTQGGFIAIKMDNAYNTNGFALQSESEGKSKSGFSYTAYSSLEEPEKVPFEFYMKATNSLPASEVL